MIFLVGFQNLFSDAQRRWFSKIKQQKNTKNSKSLSRAAGGPAPGARREHDRSAAVHILPASLRVLQTSFPKPPKIPKEKQKTPDFLFPFQRSAAILPAGICRDVEGEPTLPPSPPPPVVPLTTRAAVQVGYSLSDIIDLDDLRKLPNEFINTFKPKNIVVRPPKKPPCHPLHPSTLAACPILPPLRTRRRPRRRAPTSRGLSDSSLSALAGEGLSDMDAQG